MAPKRLNHANYMLRNEKPINHLSKKLSENSENSLESILHKLKKDNLKLGIAIQVWFKTNTDHQKI